MANKVYNMAGGLHSAAAYSAFEDAVYGSCVASADDFVATAGTGMNVSLSAGDGLISTGSGYARRIASDSTNTIPISAASATARIDSIVAYIDNSVTPSTDFVDNTNDILKFTAVSGTPAASPVAPTAATIQAAIGAGNPYMVLWNITIPAGATSLTGATFADQRVLPEAVAVADGTITTAKVADGAITEAKTNFITSSTNRLDIGSWHFYRTTFSNSTAGWVNVTLNVPNDFNGKIISVLTTATYGNSGNNYGSTWWNQTAGHVQVRINQTTAGSNGWQALVVAVF